MQITRRSFLKYLTAAAATMGLSQFELQKAMEALAKDGVPWRVVWISGQACTGCTMALTTLNSTPGGASDPDGYNLGTFVPGYDTLADVALTVIDIDAHETIQASAGDLAMDWLRPWSTAGEGAGGSLDAAVLVVEGAIPVDVFDPWGKDLSLVTGEDACTIGTIPAGFAGAGTEITAREAVVNYAQKVSAVISVGQCATYGGIPAAYSDAPDPVQDGAWSGAARGVQAACSGVGGVPGGLDLMKNGGKLINVPGCPPHPDWIYGTIVRLILDLTGTPGGPYLSFDNVGRPTAYYGQTIHGPGSCPRNQDYHDGLLASRLGDKGCLAAIGCYGMSAHSDCAKRGWNSSRLTLNKKIFCIEAGHPCIGCTEPGYPFKINTNG